MMINSTVRMELDMQNTMTGEVAREQARSAGEEARAAADFARDQSQTARDQARDQVRDQIREAIRDASDAAQSADVPTPPEPPPPPGTIVFPRGDGDGDPISLRVDGSGVHLTQNGTETVIPIRDIVPRGAVQISWAMAAIVFWLVVGWPIGRALARFIDRRGSATRANSALSAELQARFDTMERNIDTVAMEIERVSEAQRFTTKLLSERQPEFAAASREMVDQSRGGR